MMYLTGLKNIRDVIPFPKTKAWLGTPEKLRVVDPLRGGRSSHAPCTHPA